LSQITITFEGGTQKQVEKGISILQAVQQALPELVPSSIAAVVNGKITDLQDRLESDATVKVLTDRDPEGLHVFWHSASHVMAQAVRALFPDAKLGIGPSIENGFYYDFRLDRTLTAEDLPAIEAKMKEIAKANQPFVRQHLAVSEALDLFKGLGEDFKLELIQDIPADNLTVYRNGDFVDLCRGPHVPATGKIRHFKLLSVAGAYWRGDERNAVMQRIYGIAFHDGESLKRHLAMLEEARKRDHRRLGKELDLFSFQPEGPGFAFWHPNGMSLTNSAMQAVREILVRKGYAEIKTPILLNESLWHRSGHWEHYQENMYFTSIDEQPFAVKPMNCPGCVLVYRNTPRSYRDLPVKFMEMGLVHRHEKSGVLHGLFRVRQFTQDDAHVFCTPDQLEAEIGKLIDLVAEVYALFGFDRYQIEVSTRPAKSIGTEEMWRRAEDALTRSLSSKGIAYTLNPGEGAFYGPKIDYHIQDSLGRTWQCGTIQVDYSMPERFDLEYVGADNAKHRPVMIHRAIFGSIERFIGILIEHFGGAFPLWLAPEQCVVIPITDKHHEAAAAAADRLRRDGIRVRVDDRNEKMGYKIREAEKLKIPAMAVIGDREAEQGTVSVRRHGRGDLGSLPLEAFAESLKDEIARRANH
jgi:threonyl-tRNA synthetase